MANKKISQLTDLAMAAGNDLLAIVDINILETKKITVSDLMSSPGEIGGVTPNSATFTDITLSTGATVTEISTDGTLGDNSDIAVPTEKAVKTYVDNSVPTIDISYISQDDSFVRVVDDGTSTGYIEIIADGQQVAYFDALATSQRIGKDIGGANITVSDLSITATVEGNELISLVEGAQSFGDPNGSFIYIDQTSSSTALVEEEYVIAVSFADDGLKLENGVRINEFSTDGTLGGNSDLACPTEKAVKTYVDNISIISQDNSYIAVVDDGTNTGYVEIVTDGQQVAYFDALATSQRIGKAIGGAKLTVEDLAIKATVEGNDLISLDERIQTFGDPNRAFLYIDQTSTSTVELEEEYVVSVSFTDDGLKLENGTRINEFSTDDTLLDDSDLACPTEKAVKTYVDTSIAAVSVLNLGSILSVNGTYAGEVITGTVGSAGSVFGYVLYQDTDFSFYIADATSSDTAPVLAIALEDGAGSKTLLLRGQICDTSWNWSAGLVYLDESLGQITQTPPAGPVIQSIGFALSADTIFFTGYIGHSVV